MATQSYPFTASTITQAQWQSMAKMFGTTGTTLATDLAVTAGGSTMTVTVGTGSALVEGFFYNNDATISLAIGAANATLARIDTVVLRMDRTANTITALVVAGTAAAIPVPPVLNIVPTLFDYPLADVLVSPAVGVIAVGKVNDRRTLGGSLASRRGYSVAAVGTISASSNSGVIQSGVSMTVLVAGRYFWRLLANYRPTAAGTLTALTEPIIGGNPGTVEVGAFSITNQTTLIHTGYHDLPVGTTTLGVRFVTGAGTGTFVAENVTVEVYQATTIA